MMLSILLSLTVFSATSTFGANANTEQWKTTYKAGQVIGLDVRNDSELTKNPAPGAVHIPLNYVKTTATAKLANKDAEIFVFCEAGGRAEKAKKVLTDLGYKKVTNISSWREWNEIRK